MVELVVIIWQTFGNVLVLTIEQEVQFFAGCA